MGRNRYYVDTERGFSNERTYYAVDAQDVERFEKVMPQCQRTTRARMEQALRNDRIARRNGQFSSIILYTCPEAAPWGEEINEAVTGSYWPIKQLERKAADEQAMGDQYGT